MLMAARGWLKFVRLRIALLLALGCLSAIHAAADASETWMFPSGDFQRRVLIDRPQGEQPRPLVIVLHGNAQRPEDVRGRMTWQDLVAKGEIVAAFPEGINLAWMDGRAPEAFLGRRPVAGVDDVAFLVSLVDHLAGEGIVDRKRVFVTGLSNGGLMTYRLLCERADVFAGGAAIAASLWPGLAQTCQPQQPRPILVMNGTNDGVIPYDATDPASITRGKVYTVGTQETVVHWRRANGCLDDMAARAMADTDPSDQSTVTHIVWKCPPGKAVELYRINGGGHRIPALAATLQRAGIDIHSGGQNLDIDSAHEIWRFFSRSTPDVVAQRRGINTQ